MVAYSFKGLHSVVRTGNTTLLLYLSVFCFVFYKHYGCVFVPYVVCMICGGNIVVTCRNANIYVINKR